jgi:hypothetical protein
MSKVKWVALAKNAKTEVEVRTLMKQIEDHMLAGGKMTKDMDKAMDVLLGTKATEDSDMVPIELADEDLYEEMSP